MVNLGDLVFRIIAEDKASTTVGAAAAKIGQAGMAIGAGITAVGAAGTMLIDNNRKMDASFKTTALSMGVSAESVKELARSLQSVDSPISEVAATLDILARSGMENVETMGQTASAFDTLADAIGQPADTLTDAMVPAFNALNIELEDAPQYVDGLATTFRTANVDLKDFSQLMTRVGPDLGKMGLGLKDVETILMALADKGITGRKAMSELSKAIEESGGSASKLYQSLGITNTELGTYTQKLDDSKGAAQEFADAQNSAYGTLDKIRFTLARVGQAAGDALAPFEGLTTAALGIGPAVTGASSAMALLGDETVQKMVPGLGKAVTAIEGAGGLVPALGLIGPAASGAAASLGTFAVAAGGVILPLAAVAGAMLALDAVWRANGWYKTGPDSVRQAFDEGRIAIDQTTGSITKLTDASAGNAIAAGEMATQYDSVTGALIDTTTEIAEQNREIAAGIPIYDDLGVQIGVYGDNLQVAADIQYDANGAIVESTGLVAAQSQAYYDASGNLITYAEHAARAADEQEAIGNAAAAATPNIQAAAEATDLWGRAAKKADDEFTILNSTLGITNQKAKDTAEAMYEAIASLTGALSAMAASPSEGAFQDVLAGIRRQAEAGGLTPSATGTGGTGGTSAPTWAGQNDPDYTGGDPDAWRTDARLKNEAATATRTYVDAVKTVAPATREATGATTDLDAKVDGLASSTAAAVPPIASETAAVTTLGSTATTSTAGLEYFRDAQGRLTDMVLQAPMPLNAETTAIAGAAAAASGATGPFNGLATAEANAGQQGQTAASGISAAGAAAASTVSAAAGAAGALSSVASGFSGAASQARNFAEAAHFARQSLIDWNNTTANTAPGPSARKNYVVGSSVKDIENRLITRHSGGPVEFPDGASEGYAKLLAGEHVLSRSDVGGGFAAKVATAVANALSGLVGGGGDVNVHGNVNLSADYPYGAFRSDVAEWKSARIRKGALG